MAAALASGCLPGFGSCEFLFSSYLKLNSHNKSKSAFYRPRSQGEGLETCT